MMIVMISPFSFQGVTIPKTIVDRPELLLPATTYEIHRGLRKLMRGIGDCYDGNRRTVYVQVPPPYAIGILVR